MLSQLKRDDLDAFREVSRILEEDPTNDQGENIDAHLAHLERILTEDRKEGIRPYDFRQPRLLSQDHMHALQHVHTAFARDLAVYFSAQLRTIVDISLSSVEQILFSEYVLSCPPPSTLYVLEETGSGHKMVFEIDPRLVIYMVEKLFGGPGAFLKHPRELSLIEERVMGQLITRAFRELEKAWHQAYTLQLEQVSIESNAEFIQIMPGVEPVLVAIFEVTIYDQRASIHICYPYFLIEKILGQPGVKQWISGAKPDTSPEVQAHVERSLRATTVSLCAELGRARLSIQDLMQLQEGDVIPLARRVDEPLPVYIDARPKFKAAVGKSGKRHALRILEVLEPEPHEKHEQ